MSHHAAIAELGVAQPRYRRLRTELESEGYVKREAGETRRLVMTKEGRRHFESKLSGNGTVARETDLYEPLAELLRESLQDGVVLNTGSLRRRGGWMNPDLVALRVVPRALGGGIVIAIETYEVKRWVGAWGPASVYETAAHAAFSHRANLVIEWAHDVSYSFDYLHEYGEHIIEACRRFGVGLIVMKPTKGGWELERVLLASDASPSEVRTHEFAGSLLSRRRYGSDSGFALFGLNPSQKRSRRRELKGHAHG